MEEQLARRTQSVNQIHQSIRIRLRDHRSTIKGRSRARYRHMVASHSSGRRTNGSAMSSPNTFDWATTPANCVLTMEHAASIPIQGKISSPNTSSVCISKPTISKDSNNSIQVSPPHTTVAPKATAMYPTLPLPQHLSLAALQPLLPGQSPKPSPSATATYTHEAGWSCASPHKTPAVSSVVSASPDLLAAKTGSSMSAALIWSEMR
jgi:hypothetical protein